MADDRGRSVLWVLPDSPKPIDGLTFSAGKKDRIAVIGKNGKGKTTLLNLLAREMSSTSGEVKLHPNTKIAYFGQTNINRLRNDKSALQEIMDAHPTTARVNRARHLRAHDVRGRQCAQEGERPLGR